MCEAKIREIVERTGYALLDKITWKTKFYLFINEKYSPSVKCPVYEMSCQ